MGLPEEPGELLSEVDDFLSVEARAAGATEAVRFVLWTAGRIWEDDEGRATDLAGPVILSGLGLLLCFFLGTLPCVSVDGRSASTISESSSTLASFFLLDDSFLLTGLDADGPKSEDDDGTAFCTLDGWNAVWTRCIDGGMAAEVDAERPGAGPEAGVDVAGAEVDAVDASFGVTGSSTRMTNTSSSMAATNARVASANLNTNCPR